MLLRLLHGYDKTERFRNRRRRNRPRIASRIKNSYAISTAGCRRNLTESGIQRVSGNSIAAYGLVITGKRPFPRKSIFGSTFNCTRIKLTKYFLSSSRTIIKIIRNST